MNLGYLAMHSRSETMKKFGIIRSNGLNCKIFSSISCFGYPPQICYSWQFLVLDTLLAHHTSLVIALQWVLFCSQLKSQLLILLDVHLELLHQARLSHS